METKQIKQELPQEKMKLETKEIIWNLINSLLAGILVFLGGCTTGKITQQTIIIAIVAGSVVFITKFKSDVY